MTTQIQKQVVNQVASDMLVAIQPDSIAFEYEHGSGQHFQLFYALLFLEMLEHLNSLQKVHSIGLDTSPCSKLVEAMASLTVLMHSKPLSVEKVKDLLQRGFIPANLSSEPFEGEPLYVSAGMFNELCSLLQSTLYYWLEHRADLKQLTGSDDLILQIRLAGKLDCEESYAGRIHFLEWCRKLAEEEQQKKAGGAALDFDL